MEIKLTNKNLVDAIGMWLYDEGHITEDFDKSYLTIRYDWQDNSFSVEVDEHSGFTN